MLSCQLGHDAGEPCCGKEVRKKCAVGLEFIWQPWDNGLLQADDFVRIEKSYQLVVDDILIEG